MSIFAIGDIHGCHRELRRLLEVLPFDSETDHLWVVGDLVNRGPASLKVLRWAFRAAKRMGSRFQVVLGNHDLQLLAMASGVVRPTKEDTSREVLAASDGTKLLRWLGERPLVHRHDDYLLVHAGLWPHWTASEAESWARRVERSLRKGRGKGRRLLDPAIGRGQMGEGTARRQYALEAFTRLRTCTHKGKPCTHTGPPVAAPKGCMPWFEVPGRRSADVTVVCGHWAALGLRIQEGLFALDTGCVWGGALTAVRLDDGAVFSQRALAR
jgi:bis(5'-nucleosyl)-tetraphosphatase (symmetrical)